jgi:hypothetical protein
MAENAIREKQAELYAIISKSSSNIDWVTIEAMLDSLNFLNFEGLRPLDLVSKVFSLMDNWAESELTLSRKFNLLKVMKVKLTLTSFLSKTSDKSEITEICSNLKTFLLFPRFLESSKTLLKTCNPDIFSASILKVYEAFSEIRKQTTGIFMFLEKHLKLMKSQNLGEMIDQIFYESIIIENKSLLQSDSSTKQILSDFSKLTNQGLSRDDTISLSSSSFKTRAKNQYFGELNEKNERNGYGKVNYSTGDSFEGFWKEGKKSGQGLYRFRNGGSYLGNFFEDSPSGVGKRVYSSGNFYEGNFVAGKKSGNGIMTFKNGDIYQGEWDNDDIHGYGEYIWNTGDRFVGNFQRDVRHGPGILYLVTGEVVEGFWKNNILDS